MRLPSNWILLFDEIRHVSIIFLVLFEQLNRLRWPVARISAVRGSFYSLPFIYLCAVGQNRCFPTYPTRQTACATLLLSQKSRRDWRRVCWIRVAQDVLGYAPRDEGQIISLVAPPNLRVEKVGQVKLDEASLEELASAARLKSVFRYIWTGWCFLATLEPLRDHADPFRREGLMIVLLKNKMRLLCRIA